MDLCICMCICICICICMCMCMCMCICIGRAVEMLEDGPAVVASPRIDLELAYGVVILEEPADDRAREAVDVVRLVVAVDEIVPRARDVDEIVGDGPVEPLNLCVHVCIYAYVYMYMYICICIYVYAYVYMCICICI